ncbi:MAG: PTS system mannose/fructose/N-acetylgalactosamine-transporter subunit IIB [Gemmatimonadaceae bacterium]
MPVSLYRIDDRLIHGQVVAGWGQPLGLAYIILVDDVVAESDWEQELYRLGVPPSVDVIFVTVAQAARDIARYTADARVGILLTGTVEAMLALVKSVGTAIPGVNVGGIHHREDRTQKMRYVFLTKNEERGLAEIEAHGVVVTAQDLPSARALPLAEILRGEAA